MCILLLGRVGRALLLLLLLASFTRRRLVGGEHVWSGLRGYGYDHIVPLLLLHAVSLALDRWWVVIEVDGVGEVCTNCASVRFSHSGTQSLVVTDSVHDTRWWWWQ